MCKYLKIPGMLAVAFTLIGCTSVVYAPGERPLLTCRGDNAEWRLAKRDDVHSNQWYVAGEHTWSEWVAGQPLDTRGHGAVTGRVSNQSRNYLWLRMEDEAGEAVTGAALFRRIRDCVYMHDSQLLVLYARHTARDRVLWEQNVDAF